jgi:hypothetical protein
MGEYSKQDWYQKFLRELKEKYGDVPPPWIYHRDSHPYSIGWRMGSGESLIMLFGEWWEMEKKNEADRIAYFRKWPAPPRWMPWMADAIWDLKPWESEGEFDYQPYFKKLKELGFEGTEEYEKDLADEKWLEKG